MAFEVARFDAATVAAKFVLMTTDMVIFLDPDCSSVLRTYPVEAAPDRAGLSNPLL
jgi:hypothetical protein